MIFHMNNVRVTHFRFEWHPETKNVYAIASNILPEVGRKIAQGVGNQQLALALVETWCNGYKTRDDEIAERIKLQLH